MHNYRVIREFTHNGVTYKVGDNVSFNWFIGVAFLVRKLIEEV